MAKPLSEYFGHVDASDVKQYGFGRVDNFLDSCVDEKWDWIITNPPFRLAEKFIEHALAKTHKGAAFLVRTTFIESVGRYTRLFEKTPPSLFAQFVERVPMVKGRLDRRASTATGYCWLVWFHHDLLESPAAPRLIWIPPCRKRLEFLADYPEQQMSLIL